MIRKEIISPDEIIKIVIFNENTKEFLPNILENILFSDINELLNIRNYLSEILDMNCLINIRDYLLPRLKEFVFFDVSRDEATYREYIRISFKIHLESCIRNLDKKNKENFVK